MTAREVQEISSGLLEIIATHKLLRDEPDDNRLLACFLQHIYEHRNLTLSELLDAVKQCRSEVIDEKTADEALDILQVYGGIYRTNQNKMEITPIGLDVLKKPIFARYHAVRRLVR